jgi:hypothetical protein
VPVTLTSTLRADANVHDSVALPEPVTLAGLTVHEVLLVERLTTPAKPLRPVTVMVEVPAAFTLTVTLDGLAVMVKSWTTYVTVMLWVRLPAVPVTPTWKVPAELNVHDSVTVPDALTLDGDIVHAVLLVERLIVNGP